MSIPCSLSLSGTPHCYHSGTYNKVWEKTTFQPFRGDFFLHQLRSAVLYIPPRRPKSLEGRQIILLFQVSRKHSALARAGERPGKLRVNLVSDSIRQVEVAPVTYPSLVTVLGTPSVNLGFKISRLTSFCVALRHSLPSSLWKPSELQMCAKHINAASRVFPDSQLCIGVSICYTLFSAM